MKFLLLPLVLLYLVDCYGQLTVNFFHGPEAMAVGNAYTTQTGVQAGYGNPALLLMNKGFSTNLGVQNQYEVPELIIFQGMITYNRLSKDGFGISIFQAGKDIYKDQQLSLSYARPVLSNLILGVKFDWWRSTISGYPSKNKFIAEIGALYSLGSGVTLAFHIFNPFFIKYSADRAMPIFMTLGVRYHLTDYLVILGEVEKNIYSPSRIKMGIRYLILSNFDISAGMFTQDRSPNFTFGIHYSLAKHIHMDLALSYHPWLGISSAFGLDYYLGEK